MNKSEIYNEILLRKKLLGLECYSAGSSENHEIFLYADGQSTTIERTSELMTVVTRLEENNLYVFAVLSSIAGTSKIYSFLYVGADFQEWELQRSDAQKGLALAYSFNESNPELSEFGYITVQATDRYIYRKG